MIFIYMILTALATTTLAKGSIECNFSGTTGAQQCFGAVGQLLIFHLPDTANTEIRLKKDNKYVIVKIVRNQAESLHEGYVNQSELFANGSFKLGKAMKRHTGSYLLEEYGSKGALLKKVNMHLEIQAPVSKPAVTQMCLSTEQLNISCSSEGDAVEFILTLDDLLLIQTRAHKTERYEPSISNVTISLHSQLTGNFTCHVWNSVSRDETHVHLKNCNGFVSSFFVVTVAVIAGFAAAAVCLLVAWYLGIINLQNSPRRPRDINEGNAEDEIVYADVIVK